MQILNKKIAMIAEFGEDGTINPIRFRIKEGDELKVVPILRVQFQEKTYRLPILVFRCEVELNGTVKTCDLRYYRDETTWVLYSM